MGAHFPLRGMQRRIPVASVNVMFGDPLVADDRHTPATRSAGHGGKPWTFATRRCALAVASGCCAAVGAGVRMSTLTSRAPRETRTVASPLALLPILAVATLCTAWAEIFWGGVVRLSKSGLGCADNWPLCNGKVYPFWEQPVLIEYIHRLIAGADQRPRHRAPRRRSAHAAGQSLAPRPGAARGRALHRAGAARRDRRLVRI